MKTLNRQPHWRAILPKAANLIRNEKTATSSFRQGSGLKLAYIFHRSGALLLCPTASQKTWPSNEVPGVALSSHIPTDVLGMCVLKLLEYAPAIQSWPNSITGIPRELGWLVGAQSWKEFCFPRNRTAFAEISSPSFRSSDFAGRSNTHMVLANDLGGLLHFRPWGFKNGKFVPIDARIYSISASNTHEDIGKSLKKALQDTYEP